jgi:predicted DNA-binding transcriptional regulator AlpA
MALADSTARKQVAEPALLYRSPPRGLSRSEAAAYVGISPSLFDELVRDGRMPSPKRINSRTVWDRKRLDEAFEALPDNSHVNPWDRG